MTRRSSGRRPDWRILTSRCASAIRHRRDFLTPALPGAPVIGGDQDIRVPRGPGNAINHANTLDNNIEKELLYAEHGDFGIR